MLEPKKGTKWPKDLPKFKTRQEAIAVCKELCNYQYIHRSIKRGKGDLTVSHQTQFYASEFVPMQVIAKCSPPSLTLARKWFVDIS